MSDLDRSVAYYETVLGLSTLEGQEGDGEETSRWAVLGVAAEGVPLIVLHERPGAAPIPPEGRLGLFHFAILLPDRAALGRFLSHLGRLGIRPGASDHLVSEALYLSDPDGLGIEVYADRPRASWTVRGGQIAMATDPLDQGALMAAGGDAPWTGLPRGTRMGHVHLHVGDLDRASAFYHGALGLDQMVWAYPGALFLAAGGYHHHLGLNTWAPRARPADADHARLLDWTLELGSAGAVDAAVRSLSEAGHDPVRTNGGATVADPWGTTLRLEARAPGAAGAGAGPRVDVPPS